MTLKTYRAKRNFKNTPEPFGKKNATQKRKLYIIQKHAASHLHYDFRLELCGVLKSWAIPKGPSLDPKVKRLAVHVEDHPLEYGNFQGTIPKGEYGGGTVMLWDKGYWEGVDPKKNQQAYQKGDLKFRLVGKKLQGLWKLIQIKNDPKNWLLIKVDDEFAKDEQAYNVTSENLSVINQQSMEEIALQSKKIWNSNRGVATKNSKKKFLADVKIKKKRKNEKNSEIEIPNHAQVAKISTLIKPQLATLVTKIPNGGDWIYEMKFDGYRLITIMKNKKVKFFTRAQNDWTEKFPHLAQTIVDSFNANIILDGEIVALNDKNQFDFQILQNSIHEGKDAVLKYCIFDILYYDRYNLQQLPLIERKELLNKLMQNIESENIIFSKHIFGNSAEILAHACKLKFEGIVAKEARSVYQQKRSKSWLKLKCMQRQEFVIAGFTKPKGARDYFGSLLLGVYDQQKKLQYCGHVGTGFTQASLKELSIALKKIQVDKMPFQKKPALSSNVTWVEPKLVAEVEFIEWTKDDVLRHPSFKGIRQDKAAKSIYREMPKLITNKVSENKNSKKVSSKTNLDSNQLVKKSAHLKISHPEKILYPKQKFTKQDVYDYYETVASLILPYIKNRPLTLVRCPGGIEKNCFYQKHITDNTTALREIAIKDSEGKSKYFYLDNLEGLLQLVQMDTLEIHPWPCKITDVEKPDVMIFDLDPDIGLEWKSIIKAALDIKSELENLNLQSFIKTTGGKGLHIVVPIVPNVSWDDFKTYAHTFVKYLVQKNPNQYIDVMTKAKRQGKIFIDYLRNQRGATAAAPYSTRKRDGAPIATPIAWSELTTKLKPDAFNIKNINIRLKKMKSDPWEDFYKIKQSLKFK